ncbi:hypothetical protein CMUS01_11151 [Colletotrichum musicola]|uniref:Uncharacterized protein n=1 Tax=Colletotrichum musicola TaxID=2175873 RepID=A0A8H6K0T2_9PEZI|nr:hypothetical protein CMUS01_11151 [Colletotrichum musicola]
MQLTHLSARCLLAWQPGWHLEGARGTRLMKQPASGSSAGRPLFPSMICGLSKGQSFELPVRELAKREDPIDMVIEAISNQRRVTEAKEEQQAGRVVFARISHARNRAADQSASSFCHSFAGLIGAHHGVSLAIVVPRRGRLVGNGVMKLSPYGGKKSRCGRITVGSRRGTETASLCRLPPAKDISTDRKCQMFDCKPRVLLCAKFRARTKASQGRRMMVQQCTDGSSFLIQSTTSDRRTQIDDPRDQGANTQTTPNVVGQDHARAPGLVPHPVSRRCAADSPLLDNERHCRVREGGEQRRRRARYSACARNIHTSKV